MAIIPLKDEAKLEIKKMRQRTEEAIREVTLANASWKRKEKRREVALNREMPPDVREAISTALGHLSDGHNVRWWLQSAPEKEITWKAFLEWPGIGRHLESLIQANSKAFCRVLQLMLQHNVPVEPKWMRELAQEKNEEGIMLLLKYKVPITSAVCALAATHGMLQVLRWVAKHIPGSFDLESAFAVAIHHYQPGVIAFLIKNFDVPERIANRALTNAVSHGACEATAILAAAGANPEAKSSYGIPIKMAVAGKKMNIILELWPYCKHPERWIPLRWKKLVSIVARSSRNGK